MDTKQQILAAFWSFLRVFIAAAGAAFLAQEGGIFEIDSEGWKIILSAGVSAAVLTAVNWVRPGDTTFGRGSGEVDIADFYSPENEEEQWIEGEIQSGDVDLAEDAEIDPEPEDAEAANQEMLDFLEAEAAKSDSKSDG